MFTSVAQPLANRSQLLRGQHIVDRVTRDARDVADARDAAEKIERAEVGIDGLRRCVESMPTTRRSRATSGVDCPARVPEIRR